ncbi:MAG TPA: DUF2147 domain-containing protein [Rhodanobacteraceae bacterium]|nr:DUF2147 domain-containing protein [Rhodanobacteraceae bacterium]
MRIVVRSALMALALLLATAYAATESATPVGTWTQVDDATGKPKSIIEISEQPDGALQGVVKQVLFSDQGTNPKCEKCEGERHNKPVVGMTIMWGVKKDGDQWDGGQILDPNNGKIYKVKLELADNGQKLDVRGYIGMPLLGRTQTWMRRNTTDSQPDASGSQPDASGSRNSN